MKDSQHSMDNADAELMNTREEIWLLGQPPLRRYLSYVEDMVVGGAAADKAKLADEWRTANDYYYELEESEAGIADQVEHSELESSLTPLIDAIKADPRFIHTFDAMPTSFEMVELDKLVVYQPFVTLDFVDNIKMRLGPVPSAEQLFRFCLPTEHPEAPVQIQRVGSRRFVFASESTDIRFHEPVLFERGRITDYDSFGPVVGVVGLVVGFGSNLLNVIRSDNRLLLHNGYHRACALRAAGITHVPSIVQTVTRLDELDVVARREITDRAAFYFRAKRPPLLKDFFDPKIRKVFRVHRQMRMIEVNFEVRDYMVAK
jgi:hypothetical protein